MTAQRVPDDRRKAVRHLYATAMRREVRRRLELDDLAQDEYAANTRLLRWVFGFSVFTTLIVAWLIGRIA